MTFIIQAPLPALETTMLLPDPQFNDGEARRLTVEFKRSVNGTKRSYIKTNVRSTLNYQFSLTRMKALELRAFIASYYTAKLRVTNHKDEIWLCNFTSNPFEFEFSTRASGEPGGERLNISLTFEGTPNA